MINWLISDVAVPVWYYVLLVLMAAVLVAIIARALVRRWETRKSRGRHRR